MTRIFYMIFSLSLFFWTTNSVFYNSSQPLTEYLTGLAILAVAVCIVWHTDRQKTIRGGVIIVAVFMNLGLSVSYRTADESADSLFSGVIQDSFTGNLILMLVLFVILYLTVRYTRVYKFRLLNILTILALPVVVFGARYSGRLTNGSYLYFAGIMIFGLVLLGFPFAAAFFLSEKEEFYRGGNVRNLSWNLIGLLFYAFVLYLGCAVCNEFGLLLILGLTTTTLFLIRCKNGATKIFYTTVCAGGAFAAGWHVTRLWERIRIWLHPSQAYGDEMLEDKAESVLYLFRNIYRTGWWGNGIGELPQSVYPTLNSDHVLVTLINDYSIVLALLTVLLGILLVRWMLMQPQGLCPYDRYLNLVCALIVCFILLIHTASNLGSFLTAGIGFPWISEGTSSNLMLTGLLAVHCGLLGKEVREDD